MLAKTLSTLLWTAAAVGLVVVPSTAQKKKPDEQPTSRASERKKKLEKRIEDMRRAMREGRIVRYNVRVQVRLKNGNRLKGVVKNGRFIERHDGLDFVAEKKKKRHSGLRLYYYNGTRGYIFLPHREIAYYRIGNKISNAQVLAIESKLASEENERRAQSRRRAEVARQSAKATKAGKKDTGKKVSTAEAAEIAKWGRKLTSDERGQMKLLNEFPPGKGWGEKRLQELRKRRVTIGVFPNKQEKRFEDNFSKWMQALELKQELESTKDQDGDGVKTKTKVGKPGSTPASGKSGS